MVKALLYHLGHTETIAVNDVLKKRYYHAQKLKIALRIRNNAYAFKKGLFLPYLKWSQLKHPLQPGGFDRKLSLDVQDFFYRGKRNCGWVSSARNFRRNHSLVILCSR